LLPYTVLLLARKSWLVWIGNHVDENRLIRCGHTLIASHLCAWIKRNVRVVHPGCAETGNSQFVKRGPSLEQHVGVHHWNFDRIFEGFFLMRWNLRNERGDQAVVARQNTV